MKQKLNAREKRDAEALRRKQALGGKPSKAAETPAPQTAAPVPKTPPPPLPARSPEEEAREFLDYLERYDLRIPKDEPAPPSGKKPAGAGIPRLNLEDGMPVVSEALDRMRLGLQEMKHRQTKAVKLIHGYGSTGRGGKIGIGVRNELASMKRKGLIRNFIPGEDFGPTDAASRTLVERDKSVSRDPDYGRINHGITIVVL
ncbi:MAG: hypothetical protein K5922_10955 [Clostridiales bacterium]|nr:hypothetical protein [Clostridiales bacterium]